MKTRLVVRVRLPRFVARDLADRARSGPFEVAADGLLFLDEIAAMEFEYEMLRGLVPSGALVTPKALSCSLVEILEFVTQCGGPDETLQQTVERVEAWLIRRALASNGGRKASTARRLGLKCEGM